MCAYEVIIRYHVDNDKIEKDVKLRGMWNRRQRYERLRECGLDWSDCDCENVNDEDK